MNSHWDRYWFRPGPLLDLALMRLVLVGVQLYEYLSGTMGARIQGAEDSVEPILMLQLLALPFGGSDGLDAESMRLVALATGPVGLAALLGLWTRFSLPLFALGNLLVLAWVYSTGRFHHMDAMLSTALCALALSPCGRRLSIDARLQTSTPLQSEYALWPLLLTRWLLALAYLSSAGSKLLHSGLDWANGYTLQYVAFAKGMAHQRPLGIWISEQHHVAQALSVFVLLFQSTFWLLLIRPRLARLYLPAGLLLHGGIFLAMGLPFFQVMALYVVLLPAYRRC